MNDETKGSTWVVTECTRSNPDYGPDLIAIEVSGALLQRVKACRASVNALAEEYGGYASVTLFGANVVLFDWPEEGPLWEALGGDFEIQEPAVLRPGVCPDLGDVLFKDPEALGGWRAEAGGVTVWDSVCGGGGSVNARCDIKDTGIDCVSDPIEDALVKCFEQFCKQHEG